MGRAGHEWSATRLDMGPIEGRVTSIKSKLFSHCLLLLMHLEGTCAEIKNTPAGYCRYKVVVNHRYCLVRCCLWPLGSQTLWSFSLCGCGGTVLSPRPVGNYSSSMYSRDHNQFWHHALDLNAGSMEQTFHIASSYKRQVTPSDGCANRAGAR